MDNTWPVLTSTAVDRVAKLLDPEESELGPIIYTELSDCTASCFDILFACVPREEQDGFVCRMDTTMLLCVVIAAVLTGFLIPIVCIIFCFCTRFCGIFDDAHTEKQELIHSDMRQDWNSCLSSTECQQQPILYSQNENSQGSIGAMPLLSNCSPNNFQQPSMETDEPYRNTVISSTGM